MKTRSASMTRRYRRAMVKIWSKLLRCLGRALSSPAGRPASSRRWRTEIGVATYFTKSGDAAVLGGEVALRLVGEPLEDVRPVILAEVLQPVVGRAEVGHLAAGLQHDEPVALVDQLRLDVVGDRR